MNSDNKNTNILVVTVILSCLLFLHNRECNNAYRPNEAFYFDTDRYLRRIVEKLDKIFDQIDTTPYGWRQYFEIRDEAKRSELIVSSALEQLELLHLGKLHTGYWAKVIPNFLRKWLEADAKDSILTAADHDRIFDFINSELIANLSKSKIYTKEEIDNLRKTLPDRSLNTRDIERRCEKMIDSNLLKLIDYKIMGALVEGNNNTCPAEIDMMIRDYREKFMWCKKFNNIMQAIRDKKIDRYTELDHLIEKVFIRDTQSNKAVNQTTTLIS